MIGISEKRKKDLGIKGRRGFTLIEVIASLAIVGVAFVSISQVFAMSGKAVSVSKESMIVSNLLRYKIEEMKCMAFSDDLTSTGIVPGYTPYIFNVTQTTPWKSNVYLKKVDVSVTWTSALGGTRVENTSFLVADR